MKIGVYQHHPRFGEVEANVQRAIQDLMPVEADLVVLPELFSTGYQFVSKKEAVEISEPIPEGRTCRALYALAREKKMYLVFGLAEKAGAKCYNSAVVAGPKGIVGVYRKIHLFAEEKYWFEPGDSGFQVFDLKGVKIGVMICFDWFFPESTRILTLMGADIICHPANLVLPHCQRAMITRSLENGVFTATANRIGTEQRGSKDPLTFTGASQITGHRGELLSSLKPDKTGIAVAEIDPTLARNKQITRQNDRLADRRPEFYRSLVELP